MLHTEKELFRFQVRNANNCRVGRAQRAPPILLRSAFGGARFTLPTLLLHLKSEEPLLSVFVRVSSVAKTISSLLCRGTQNGDAAMFRRFLAS